MRIRLTPRQNSFYGMFATSGRNLMEGAGLLKEMLGADLSERKEIAERMRKCEHAGDEATHAIMRELNETFVTPFDREDIYRLASSLDDVMDYMEAAVTSWCSTTSRSCRRRWPTRSRCSSGRPS